MIDYFNQPITENSKLLVPVGGVLKVCYIVRMNRKTIVVKDLNYKNGMPIRTTAEQTIVLSGEDMTVLAMRKGLRL